MIVGVVGLGNMGGALAANLVGAGFEVVGHDARPQSIDGVRFVASLDEVDADVVVLSLPDAAASEAVCRQLRGHVVDTSTIGVAAARRNADLRGITYVDAPVSGGVAGARARTLTVMYAGGCEHVEPVLAGLSDRRVRVGERAGMAQAMKLANNFLSATALAATAEAIAFGVEAGLDMATMLEVLNASSGQSAATTDKFPNHVLPGRFASGFANTLMAKDVGLYLDEVGDGPARVGAVTAAIWQAFAAAEPGVDFTRIHPFVANSDSGVNFKTQVRSTP